jgi:hypothetical protein
VAEEVLRGEERGKRGEKTPADCAGEEGNVSMIQDIQRWQAFENDLISKQKPNYAENLRLVDGMYDLARKLGKFTAEDALDGLDNTIHLAAILHHVRRTP